MSKTITVKNEDLENVIPDLLEDFLGDFELVEKDKKKVDKFLKD